MATYKKCRTCNEKFSPNHFYRITDYKRHTQCKHCMLKNLKIRNRYKKKALVEYSGGKCVMCEIKFDGTNQCIFDFHHKDKDTKSFMMNEMSRGLPVLKEEVNKCIMLCSNCHRMLHFQGKA